MQTFNTLSDLQPLRGYWLHLTTAGTPTISGAPLGTSGLTLTPGWNLVGYSGSASEPVTTVLGHVANQADIVLGFDAGQGGALSYCTAQSMQPFNNLTTLQPNQGYWLHLTGTANQSWRGQ